MSLSTFFQDSKVAGQVGGILLSVPVILFLQLLTTQSKLIYVFFFIPSMPAMTLIVKLTTATDTSLIPIDVTALDPSYISYPIAWGSLILSIFVWFYIYIYLDSVMPSEYGI